MTQRRQPRRHRGAKVSKTGCISGKYRYADKSSAIVVMHNTQVNRGEEGANRVYDCDLCNGWHLTSKRVHGHVDP